MKTKNYRKIFGFAILFLYFLVATLIVSSSIVYVTNQIRAVELTTIEIVSVDSENQTPSEAIPLTNPSQGFFEKIAVPIVLYILTFLYEPLRESLKNSYAEFISLFVWGKYCRIFIFGERGSGKTSLIERFLASTKPTRFPSTKEYHLYKGSTKHTLEGKTIGIFIADYAGEKQYQILQNPPEDFFGSPDSPIVNAIIFIVDLFPAKYNKTNGNEVSVSELLSDYDATNSMKNIRERLAEHEDYLSTQSILSALAASVRKQAATVKFVVNKIDILRELLIKGYLTDETGDKILSAEKFALQIYSPLIKKVSDICNKVSEDNKIKIDFGFHFISAYTGDSVDDVIGSIIENYIIKEGKIL